MVRKLTGIGVTTSNDSANYLRPIKEDIWQLENTVYKVKVRLPGITQYTDFVTFCLINVLPMVELPIKLTVANDKELKEIVTYEDKVQACLQTFANVLGTDDAATKGKQLATVFSNAEGCDYLYRSLSEVFLNVDIRNCEMDLFLLCVIRFINYLSEVFGTLNQS